MLPSSRDGTFSTRRPSTFRVVSPVVKRPFECNSLVDRQPPPAATRDMTWKPATALMVVITIVFAGRGPRSSRLESPARPSAGPQAETMTASARTSGTNALVRKSCHLLSHSERSLPRPRGRTRLGAKEMCRRVCKTADEILGAPA